MAPPGKRGHIVETAYRLFRAEGFHATGIDRIIAEAGIAKMTLYRHFPGKDDLIVEILGWREEVFEHKLERLLAPMASPRQRIEAVFGWYERWFQQPDFRGCLFQHALGEFGETGHPVHIAARHQKSALEQRFQSMLNPLPPDQAATLATALLLLIEGATLLAEIGQGEAAMAAARASLDRLLKDAGL